VTRFGDLSCWFFTGLGDKIISFGDCDFLAFF